MIPKTRILVVDDEPGIRKSLTGILEDEGYGVESVESGEEAVSITRQKAFDAMLLDVWLPGINGLEVLERLVEDGFSGAVIMISGHANIEMAVKATRMGAYDFIEKPLSLEKALLALRNAITHSRLLLENKKLKERFTEHHMVGESPAIVKLKENIRRAAPTEGRIFIFGESGSGKELAARLVHRQSHRASGPFVEVNCAAIPEDLIESELFGHVKGAFTDAHKDKRGKFEAAHGGTLFLDEIADMSLRAQAKVLRILQDGVFERVGDTKPIESDVRVIAATNKDLKTEIKAGRFREDLFFRLHVVPLNVPPLRERRADIPLLADYFMERFFSLYGMEMKTLRPDTLEHLTRYPWPGNIREFKNMVERIMIMVQDPEVTPQDLPYDILHYTPQDKEIEAPSPKTHTLPLKEARGVFEKQLIAERLERFNGNVTKTAADLGIERSHLYRKMKAYGLHSSEAREN